MKKPPTSFLAISMPSPANPLYPTSNMKEEMGARLKELGMVGHSFSMFSWCSEYHARRIHGGDIHT